jgi:hypothetical protein
MFGDLEKYSLVRLAYAVATVGIENRSTKVPKFLSAHTIYSL